MTAWIIGWSATALYLLAQAYISLDPNYRKGLYYGMNIVAGVGLASASVVFESWQAVAVNSYWALISGLTLFGLLARLRLNVPIRTQLFLASAIIVSILIWTVQDSGLDWIGGIGWIGTLLYCGSYFALSIGSLRRIPYLWVNGCSGALLLPVYMQTDNWPSFVLNVLWVAISVFGALRHDGQQVERVAPTPRGR